jgi:O-antigen/teichoic acid export membrane protein
VSLLTTEAYLSTPAAPGSDTALTILAAAIVFNTVVMYCFYTLLTRNAWQPLVRTLVFGAAISLVSNLLLIPRLGFVGAAATSAGVHALLALLLLPQSFAIFPIRLPKGALQSLLLFGILTVVMLLGLRPWLVGTEMTALGLCMALGLTGAAGWASGLLQRVRERQVA